MPNIMHAQSLRCAGAELVAMVDPSDIAQAAMRSDVAKLVAEVGDIIVGAAV